MIEEQGADPPDVQASRAQRLNDENQRPATVGSVRSLRRWLIVAGVWAVAATAIAVFALVKADEADDAGREQAAGDLDRVQRQLDDRLDDVERQIEAAPTSDDLSKLDDRLAEIEDGASQTGEDLDRLSGRLDDLEQQVQELDTGGTGTGTETTETTP
jgi:septal ring factor EnvC (AmiA/AmiB activator)